jgi:peptidyl-tRNA hydrolase, PTH2 family
MSESNVVPGADLRSHKQVLVMRKDLKMRTGKLAAQAAHASMGAILSRATIENGVMHIPMDAQIGPWLSGLFAKVVLGVESEAELRALHEAAKAAGLPCALIEDSGLTEFKGVPTLTGLAVGPALKSDVDQITGHLPLNL